VIWNFLDSDINDYVHSSLSRSLIHKHQYRWQKTSSTDTRLWTTYKSVLRIIKPALHQLLFSSASFIKRRNEVDERRKTFTKKIIE